MAAYSLNHKTRFNLKQKEGKVRIDSLEYVDGIPLVSGVSSENIKNLRRNVVTRADDVFVVTYPKCGTTWMRQILKLLANNGIESKVNVDTFCPFVDAMLPEELENTPSPRYLQSHLSYSLMPGGGNPAETPAKYIYVIRNPKDTAVSFFHWIPTYFIHDKPKPWEEFFDDFFNGNVPGGSFYSHILSWWNHRDSTNILFLSYEQMKRDLHSAVASIATFLGFSFSQDIIEKIAEQSSFLSMKNNPAANWSTEPQNLMRKGVIGDWKNMFTKEQSARVDTIVAEKFKGTGLVFDYGDDYIVL